MKHEQLIIYSDGGSRGNPGPAAYGFVIKTPDNDTIFEHGEYIGITTNNVAEYTGVLKATEWISKNHPNVLSLSIIVDSELVARQMSGIYKIKNENLKRYYLQIKSLEKNISGKISYTSVPRAENKHADSLVNKALDTLLA